MDEDEALSGLDARHDAVGSHYDLAAYDYEVRRLELNSPVERAMMERYLRRFVPQGSTVADIGVGAGHYDELLARRGCRLYMADVSPRLLQTALDRLAAAGLADNVLDARSASATDLGHLADGSCDVVLLLGPLYHLLTPQARRWALREARRVLRPGGLLFAAAVNRLQALVAEFYTRPELCPELMPLYRQFLADGIVEPEDAPTIGHAHFSTPDEFRELFRGLFDERMYVGLESFTGSRQKLLLELDADVREAWLDLVEETGQTPEGLAFAEHLLFVGRPRPA